MLFFSCLSPSSHVHRWSLVSSPSSCLLIYMSCVVPVFKCVASSLVFLLSPLLSFMCSFSSLSFFLTAFSFCSSSLVVCLLHACMSVHRGKRHDKTLGPVIKRFITVTSPSFLPPSRSMSPRVYLPASLRFSSISGLASVQVSSRSSFGDGCVCSLVSLLFFLVTIFLDRLSLSEDFTNCLSSDVVGKSRSMPCQHICHITLLILTVALRKSSFHCDHGHELSSNMLPSKFDRLEVDHARGTLNTHAFPPFLLYLPPTTQADARCVCVCVCKYIFTDM